MIISKKQIILLLMCFSVTAAIAQVKPGITPKVIDNVRSLRSMAAEQNATYQTTEEGGGTWKYDSADATTPDNTGTVIVSASGARFKRIYDGPVNVKWFGAVGDGTTDDTKALQKAIDQAVTHGYDLFVPKGIYLTGPLNLNGSSTVAAKNVQLPAVSRLQGAGRSYHLCVFKALPGAYAPGQAVITVHNSAAVEYSNFSVDGNNVATIGCDFRWIGGSSNTPGLAPSNQNILENIFVEGCSDISFLLDQFHDSKISGLWCRGSKNLGIDIKGSGGQIIMDACYISNGKFRIACQNAGITNCGFFGGIEITGSGYNDMVFTGCHIYPASDGLTINSTAHGSATVGVAWIGCYFNAGGQSIVAGTYWQGMTFIADLFNGYTGDFYGDIHNNGGSGQPAVFIFQHCTFKAPLPDKKISQFIQCLSVTGYKVDDHYAH